MHFHLKLKCNLHVFEVIFVCFDLRLECIFFFGFTDISGMENEEILSGSNAKQHEQQLKLLQEKVCSFLGDCFTVLLVLTGVFN